MNKKVDLVDLMTHSDISDVKASSPYTEEFKINCVNTFLQGKKSFEDLSQDLGVPLSTLHGWVAKARGNLKKTKERKEPLQQTNAEEDRWKKEAGYLELRLLTMREERDFLKRILDLIVRKIM